MTRAEAKALAEQVREALDGKRSSVHVGTWMDRPGVSLSVTLTSAPLGKRFDVHKWDDEETCEVRLITGDAWRRPAGFREFAKVEGVEFSAEEIAKACGACLYEVAS